MSSIPEEQIEKEIRELVKQAELYKDSIGGVWLLLRALLKTKGY